MHLEVIKERVSYERKKFLNKCSKPKEFFNYVSNRTNCTRGIPSIRSGDIELTGDAEKGEAFSQYYSSVYTRDNNLMPSSERKMPANSFTNFEFTYDSIVNAVKKIECKWLTRS